MAQLMTVEFRDVFLGIVTDRNLFLYLHGFTHGYTVRQINLSV